MPIMIYRVLQLRANEGLRALPADGIRPKTSYSIRKGRIEHVKLVLRMDESAPLIQALRKVINTSPSEESLIAIIDRAGQSGNRQAILRILNARWNHLSFRPKEYIEARHFDPASPAWRLHAAVTARFIQIAQQSGAKVALFNETEADSYRWEVSWYKVEDTPRNRELYLSHVALLKEIAEREHAWMIPNRRLYERARNNGHPNARGNQAIADDIYDFLRTEAKLIPSGLRLNPPPISRSASMIFSASGDVTCLIASIIKAWFRSAGLFWRPFLALPCASSVAWSLR
jgi:lysophospholipase L1-like esterase